MINNPFYKSKTERNTLTTNFKKTDPIQQKLEAAEAKIAELQQKCDHKDKILSVLAHDLRSPLSSISGLISIFEGNDAQLQLELHVTELKKQLFSVNELMNNLLRWASRSFDKEQYAPPIIFNLDSVIQLNINLLTCITKEKNISLNNHSDSRIPTYANADQIDIVIRNLLLNAVKFTPPGGSIAITATTDNVTTYINITDTGIGMSPEQLTMIFSNMHFSSYGTSGERGFGLGLLLCKEYIDENNGTISITSEPNKGTSVSITLPATAN